jgi:acyl-CoA-binding protein
MTELEQRFAEAAQAAQQLAQRPDNTTLLQLYALYKQATQGDVAGKRPGVFDVVGRAKYDAWAKQSGVAREAAMEAYVALVKRLQGH